jgi:TetR/AcrR family transcriptional regulator, transcriptional repressor for nem operon
VGRPKTYDRSQVLETAMNLFWQRGFHQVSTRDLSEAMGINVYSLYAEFENKEGLFNAAIEHYEHHMVPFYIGALERSDASPGTISEVLNSFPAFAESEGFVPGCLITNAATELAPNEHTSQVSTARYFERLTSAYLNALGTGDGTDRGEAVALARFLSTTTLGLFVLLRAQTDRGVLQDAVDTALAAVEAHTNRPPNQPFRRTQP